MVLAQVSPWISDDQWIAVNFVILHAAILQM
jgi:hypothetical protein